MLNVYGKNSVNCVEDRLRSRIGNRTCNKEGDKSDYGKNDKAESAFANAAFVAEENSTPMIASSSKRKRIDTMFIISPR